MTAFKRWKGYCYPHGATWTGSGVNFALFSENATGVELCLFDESDGQPLPAHSTALYVQVEGREDEARTLKNPADASTVARKDSPAGKPSPTNKAKDRPAVRPVSPTPPAAT